MVNKLNLNWPEFLEKYWQKKPVVLKNAFPEEVLSALNAGEKLIRLSGLRVLRIGEHFFVNTEGWMTTEIKGADTLCRLTEVGVNELGEALENPVFVAELTEFINQGYWYFDE